MAETLETIALSALLLDLDALRKRVLISNTCLMNGVEATHHSCLLTRIVRSFVSYLHICCLCCGSSTVLSIAFSPISLYELLLVNDIGTCY